MRLTLLSVVVLFGFGGPTHAADYPKPVEANVVLKDFRFATGETLDLKVHYRTIGTLRRDMEGKVLNAVLIMHGTTGSGTQFVGDGSPTHPFAGELFPILDPQPAEAAAPVEDDERILSHALLDSLGGSCDIMKPQIPFPITKLKDPPKC